MLPSVHEAVEEEPEELLPVLGGVQAPVLPLLLVQAHPHLVLDGAPEIHLVFRHSQRQKSFTVSQDHIHHFDVTLSWEILIDICCNGNSIFKLTMTDYKWFIKVMDS